MRSQASSEGRRTLTLLGCRARRRLRHDGRVATAVLGRADAHVQPALGLVVTADAGCLSNRFCSVLLCPCMGSMRFRSVSSPAAVLRRSAFRSTDLAGVLGFNFTNVLAPAEGLPPSTAQIADSCHGIRILAICSCGGISQICQWYRVCDAGALRAEPLGHPLYLARSKFAGLPNPHDARMFSCGKETPWVPPLGVSPRGGGADGKGARWSLAKNGRGRPSTSAARARFTSGPPAALRTAPNWA